MDRYKIKELDGYYHIYDIKMSFRVRTYKAREIAFQLAGLLNRVDILENKGIMIKPKEETELANLYEKINEF